MDTRDSGRLLDVTRGGVLEDRTDWPHANALLHDPRDDSRIISGRNQDVIKVGSGHRVRWIFAPQQGKPTGIRA